MVVPRTGQYAKRSRVWQAEAANQAEFRLSPPYLPARSTSGGARGVQVRLSSPPGNHLLSIRDAEKALAI